MTYRLPRRQGLEAADPLDGDRGLFRSPGPASTRRSTDRTDTATAGTTSTTDKHHRPDHVARRASAAQHEEVTRVTLDAICLPETELRVDQVFPGSPTDPAGSALAGLGAPDREIESVEDALAAGLALPCQDHDPDLFFAEDPLEVERAKALCTDCPVRALCFEAALARHEPWGVWGGEWFADGVAVGRKRPRGRPRKDGSVGPRQAPAPDPRRPVSSRTPTREAAA